MKLTKNKIVIILATFIALILLSVNAYATMITVTTDTLKLRKEPSTTSTVLELLSYNEKYEVIEKTGDWYKIKYEDYTGYVHKDYVKEDTKETDSNEPIEEQPSEETTNEGNQTDTNTEVIIAGEMQLLEQTELKATPIIYSTAFAVLEKGTSVKIITVLNGWAYVQVNEMNGWIRKEKLVNGENNSNSQIETSQKENLNENYQEKTMYVKESSINVRSQSNTNSEIITQLVLNKQVTVIGEENDWYKVQVNGKEGFILKSLLSEKKITTTTRSGNNTRTEQITKKETNEKTTEENKEATTSTDGNTQDIVSYAKKFLGCRYVYGGSGPSTFDCSGFTMYVYKHFGINLSHSATAQSKQGKRIDRSNIQPGDLVTFNDSANISIGHIGLYIGNGQFIHAASGKGKVIISSLSESYYNKRLVAITRVI